MTRLTEAITNTTVPAPDEFIHHSRMGQVVNKWVETAPGADQTVLTNATLVYNIPEGKMFFIAGAIYAVTTASDSCVFDLGYTSAVDGAGDFTAVIHSLKDVTGTARTGSCTHHEAFRLPICLRYSDGVRSITWRVDANDAIAEIMVGFYGWYEDEL